MQCDTVAQIDNLPADVLSRIFEALSPLQLAWAERVCCRFRAIIVQRGLWRSQCLAAHPAVADAVSLLPPDLSQVPVHRAAPAPAALLEPHAAGQQQAVDRSAEEGQWSNLEELHLPAACGPQAAANQLSAEVLQSALYKRFHYRLTAPLARESLIAEALAASSTDHPQEWVGNVLSPGSRSMSSYWSSRGSQVADSGEALAFRLAHPLCLVSEVQLRPFKAFFQHESPIYAPRAVRFRLGGVACFASHSPGGALPTARLQAAAQADLRRDLQAPHADAAVCSPAACEAGSGPGTVGSGGPPGSAGRPKEGSPQARPRPSWVWVSPAYEVAQQDVLQRFPIPPTLCVGGYLRVELLGRTQRQAIDDLYYTCVCYVRAVGTPVYSFLLREVRPGAQLSPELRAAAAGRLPVWRLAYRRQDPLLAAGGLAAVSEGGRLAGRSGSLDGEGSSDDESSFGMSSVEEESDGDEELLMGGSDVEGMEHGHHQLPGPPAGGEVQEGHEEWGPGGDAGAY